MAKGRYRHVDNRDSHEGGYRQQVGGQSVYRGEVDPETGHVITYGRGTADGRDTKWGRERAKRKAERRTDRERAKELYQTRMAESRRRFGEARDDLDTAWDGAEDELPDYMDLLGGDADPVSNRHQSAPTAKRVIL